MSRDPLFAGEQRGVITGENGIMSNKSPPPSPPEALLVTVAQAAAMLTLSDSSIRKLIDQGRLPAVRLGTSVRLKRADVERAAKEGC